MYIHITGTDLFDQNAGKVGSEVRLRCLWVSLVLIYLSNMLLRCVTEMYMAVIGIDLFSQNAGKIYSEV